MPITAADLEAYCKSLKMPSPKLPKPKLAKPAPHLSGEQHPFFDRTSRNLTPPRFEATRIGPDQSLPSASVLAQRLESSERRVQQLTALLNSITYQRNLLLHLLESNHD